MEEKFIYLISCYLTSKCIKEKLFFSSNWLYANFTKANTFKDIGRMLGKNYPLMLKNHSLDIQILCLYALLSTYTGNHNFGCFFLSMFIKN